MNQPTEKSYECCILGAGPAGLACAHELTENGITDILIVDKNASVGGLSRTNHFSDALFDVGPHRFFTKSEEVDRLWHETLGSDFKPVSRTTRLLYNDKCFNYPLKASEILLKLGPLQAASILLSFGGTKIRFKASTPVTFEDWVVRHFGSKLYHLFFRTYTEKVWGLPGSQIDALWASQRIAKLNVYEILKKAMGIGKDSQPKSLVETFHYPQKGCGQMYAAMAEKIADRGVEISLGTQAKTFFRDGQTLKSLQIRENGCPPRKISARHFFSSIPLTHMIQSLDPPPYEATIQASRALYYREHINVDFLLDQPNPFSDQWIYIHSSDVCTARIANYNNFSSAMSGGADKTALGVEFFAFQNEPLWNLNDQDLTEFAADELTKIGLFSLRPNYRAQVVRETESYPVYFVGYGEPYEALKDFTQSIENLTTIGRGGLYRYNNQDHSVMSGLLAARNYLNNSSPPFDLWSLNTDSEYGETVP